MPISVRWYDFEKSIVHYQFKGKWTLLELNAVVKEFQSWNVTFHFDVVVDMKESRGIPTDMLSQLRSLQLPMGSSDWSVAVLVTNDNFAMRLVKAFTAVFPQFGQRFAFAETEDEALKLIEDVRKTLPPEKLKRTSE